VSVYDLSMCLCISILSLWVGEEVFLVNRHTKRNTGRIESIEIGVVLK